MKNADRRVRALAVSLLSVFPVLAADAKKGPELVGTIPFDVASASGRIETMEVTIGDGGSGPYKAILSGDPGLPTHALYRPRDLRPFGNRTLLPIVAFANGGCRNTSGEFRNFLSDIASQGFLVVAIGPAANAVIMGSEERTNTTASSQLLDGVTWAIAENARPESAFYRKLDTTKVAVMGQSCGAQQAIEVSLDPRVTTTIALNQGIRTTPTPTPNPAAANAGPRRPEPARDTRYAPHAPALMRAPVAEGAAASSATPSVDRTTVLQKLHAPILFVNGGPKDSGYPTAKSNYEAIEVVPAVMAYQEVGHYPATYRQPNGGAFAKAVGGWLKWHLKGDPQGKKMFTGEACGLCSDSTWTIQRKKIE